MILLTAGVPIDYGFKDHLEVYMDVVWTEMQRENRRILEKANGGIRMCVEV